MEVEVKPVEPKTAVSRRATRHLNVRLKRLVTKFITPVVLLAGLLLLALFEFKGEVKRATTQQQAFTANVVYSAGQMQETYQANAGVDRPTIAYAGKQLLSYADWSSSITVDGNVQELWNHGHGYSVDDAHRQIFETTFGDNWQLVKVITLVNDHTLDVAYKFAARKAPGPEPQHIVLDVAHVEPGQWYNPHVQGSTFTASVLPVDIPTDTTATGGAQPSSFSSVNPLGTLSLNVASAGTPANTPVTLRNVQYFTGADGTQGSWAPTVMTEYVLNNPQVDRVVDLGHETVTFTPAQTNAGAPVSVPIGVNTATP